MLYPDDRTYQGKELRLKQQHFFVSATIQACRPQSMGSVICALAHSERQLISSAGGLLLFTAVV